jgi:YD repeat-containing protein
VTDPLNNVTTFGTTTAIGMRGPRSPIRTGRARCSSPVWTYQLDAAGQMVEVLDPLGRDTDYGYDGAAAGHGDAARP